MIVKTAKKKTEIEGVIRRDAQGSLHACYMSALPLSSAKKLKATQGLSIQASGLMIDEKESGISNAEREEREEKAALHAEVISPARPGRRVRRVNVDFPEWMIEALDMEARDIGITRQALIKTVINDHLRRNSQG